MSEVVANQEVIAPAGSSKAPKAPVKKPITKKPVAKAVEAPVEAPKSPEKAPKAPKAVKAPKAPEASKEAPKAEKPVKAPKADEKAPEAPKVEPKAEEKKTEEKKDLRKPQARLLKALLGETGLTRKEWADKAGVDNAMCTSYVGATDDAVRLANDARYFPSLVSLGLVKASVKPTEDDKTVTVYSLTANGKKKAEKLG